MSKTSACVTAQLASHPLPEIYPRFLLSVLLISGVCLVLVALRYMGYTLGRQRLGWV